MPGTGPRGNMCSGLPRGNVPGMGPRGNEFAGLPRGNMPGTGPRGNHFQDCHEAIYLAWDHMVICSKLQL